MSEDSVIVWDLETVPDLAATARLFDLTNASEVEVREAIGPMRPRETFSRNTMVPRVSRPTM